MTSTNDLSGLPDLEGLRRLTQALAALDAVLCPEWEYRYYSFDSEWGEDEMMASMRDGEGDHWFALLCPAGAALVGLAHESPDSPSATGCAPDPRLFGSLPAEFHANVLQEPAFNADVATFCIWRLTSDDGWSTGHAAPADGSDDLLEILGGNPETYRQFASEYFEVDVSIDDVRAVYAHAPMTRELASRLNPEIDYDALTTDLAGIGYPLDSQPPDS